MQCQNHWSSYLLVLSHGNTTIDYSLEASNHEGQINNIQNESHTEGYEILFVSNLIIEEIGDDSKYNEEHDI